MGHERGLEAQDIRELVPFSYIVLRLRESPKNFENSDRRTIQRVTSTRSALLALSQLLTPVGAGLFHGGHFWPLPQLGTKLGASTSWKQKLAGFHLVKH